MYTIRDVEIQNQHAGYVISIRSRLLKLKIALFLLMGWLLLPAADKSSQTAQCLTKCKQGCTKSFDSCKKTATTKTAIAACQKSNDLCGAVCVNKTCRSESAK